MQKFFALFFISCALSGCMEDAKPSYAHSDILQCPAAVPIPNEALLQLRTYPERSTMDLFAKAYVKQQNELDAFHRSQIEHCPPAFWVDDTIAGEFRRYPAGSPMREFFKIYVSQQRAIDAYYTPATLAPVQ